VALGVLAAAGVLFAVPAALAYRYVFSAPPWRGLALLIGLG
jgi:hypothetical protein